MGLHHARGTRGPRGHYRVDHAQAAGHGPGTVEMNALAQGEIEAGLRQLGLIRGSVVEVHSALSSFGPVEGGAATVIAALMAVVGAEGALVMSAYLVSPAI